MAIKAGDLLGYWRAEGGISYPTKAVQFGDNPQLYPATEYMGGLVVRSRNFVLSTASSFTQSAGITDADITAAFQASQANDAGGFLPPAGFVSPPTGYFEVTDSQGRKYIKLGLDKDGDGVADDMGGGQAEQGTRSASVFDQAWTWIKANPLIVAGVVIVVIYLYNNSGGKKKKKFLGLL